jgi:hypothetical protein
MSNVHKLVPTQAEPPALAALHAHGAHIAELTRRRTEVQAAADRAGADLREHQTAVAALNDLRALRKQAGADQYLGRTPAASIASLDRDIAAAELEIEALAATAEGAQAAIDELSNRIGDLNRNITSAEAQQPELRHAVLRERMVAMLPRYTAARDAFLAQYTELVAVGQAADVIRNDAVLSGHPAGPAMPPLAVALPRTVNVPVPLNMPAFDAVGRPVSVREQVEAASKQILAEPA